MKQWEQCRQALSNKGIHHELFSKKLTRIDELQRNIESMNVGDNVKTSFFDLKQSMLSHYQQHKSLIDHYVSSSAAVTRTHVSLRKHFKLPKSAAITGSIVERYIEEWKPKCDVLRSRVFSPQGDLRLRLNTAEQKCKDDVENWDKSHRNWRLVKKVHAHDRTTDSIRRLARAGYMQNHGVVQSHELANNDNPHLLDKVLQGVFFGSNGSSIIIDFPNNGADDLAEMHAKEPIEGDIVWDKREDGETQLRTIILKKSIFAK